MLELLAAGTATALATGLGAIPVFFLGREAVRLRAALWGFAAGVMAVAAVAGLLAPALDEGSFATVAAGLVAGIAFLAAARLLIGRRDPRVGAMRGAGVRTSLLVFGVLFVHSIPEGLAMGTAYASETSGLALFVILAIAIQNVPEGTSVALPMEQAGFSHAQQFWAAVATSLPQPAGAAAAYAAVQEIEGLLPASFAFAAGAMLALVVAEMLPAAFRDERRGSGAAGALAGATGMAMFAVALGV